MSGIGLSTVSTITKEVSQAIIDLLWEESVTQYMPHSEFEFIDKMVEIEKCGSSLAAGEPSTAVTFP